MTLTPGEPRDLLDALLIGQMKGSGEEDDITEDHVLMTAAEAFGAGVETTSTTLLWTIAFLLHHPQVHTATHCYYHIYITIMTIDLRHNDRYFK